MPSAASSTPAGPSGTIALHDEHGYDRLLAAVAARVAAATGPLFTTSSADLLQTFLAALPPEDRQGYTCGACRRFFDAYGGLVTVSEHGALRSVLWADLEVPDYFAAAVAALDRAVRGATIRGVFLRAEETWGKPVTGPWRHLSGQPSVQVRYKFSPVQTAAQARAEKAQDYETLQRGLAEFPAAQVAVAVRLLESEALYRSEKVLGVATWLRDLHEARAKVQGTARDNLVWRAVAMAPPGFCHVKSTMIGTLLEDIAAGLDFETLKRRFADKMRPDLYQRPQAPPSAGNIASAEKIVAQLQSAGALRRRYARLSEVVALWRPRAEPQAPPKGVFGHLLPTSKAKPVEGGEVTITWEKFQRTVLSGAERIELLVPSGNSSFGALVTASDPEAPPILQWDRDERRNPFSWYFYVNGSRAQRWNLVPGAWVPVTAITLKPSMWTSEMSHQGKGVFFLLQGCRDVERGVGLALFPETLRAEYHAIRKTIEAFSARGDLDGREEADACGVGMLAGSGSWGHTARVTAGGVVTTYKLDRWD